MQLSKGQIGESYQVEDIDLPFQMKRRLEALGMTRHAPLAVLHRKGKGILIVKLRGSRFALGYNITRQIDVQPVGEPTDKPTNKTAGRTTGKPAGRTGNKRKGRDNLR